MERKERFYQKAANIESNDERKTRKRKPRDSFSPSRDTEKQPRTKKSTNVANSSMEDCNSPSQQQKDNNQQNHSKETANGIIGYRKPIQPKGRQLLIVTFHVKLYIR